MTSKILRASAALGVALAVVGAAPAFAFELSFDWGNIPKCTSGNPNSVKNPQFKLAGVPAGTKSIRFKLVDLDVPQYNHGGGKVAWAGKPTIAPGAFTYQSPCPPNGRHKYQWTATALGDGNKALATAKAMKQYP